MVSLYFGLPGSGKTTLLTKFVLEAIKGKKYKNVYCNIPLNINGMIYINEDDLGVYQIDNGLIVFDESTIAFDSRNFNKRSKNILDFFMLHRHYNTDILLFAQGWDTCDKRIRQITDRVYYVYKGIFTGHWFSKYWRIPYDILFPDPKRGNEGLGQIIQGYKKPSIFVRLFARKCYRPKYYKYFDSWSAPVLRPLPTDRIYLNSIPLESKAKEKKYIGKSTERSETGRFSRITSCIKTALLSADNLLDRGALALRP